MPFELSDKVYNHGIITFAVIQKLNRVKLNSSYEIVATKYISPGEDSKKLPANV